MKGPVLFWSIGI